MFKKIRFAIAGKLLASPSRDSGRCGKYEARLEDYLQGRQDSDVSDHIRQCGDCRVALEQSRMGGQLLRDAWEPAGETSSVAGSHPRSAFVSAVMMKIREEQTRAASPAAFWNPLEFLASRLSLTAAMVLFALSVYMVGFAPRRAPTLSPSARTELNAADFPQPPGDPDSNEEVLQSLLERNNGR